MEQSIPPVISITVIIAFAGALTSILFTIFSNRIKKLERVSDDHEKRILQSENLTTYKVDQLIKEMKELKDYVHEKLHQDSNREQAFTNTIQAALNTIEKQNVLIESKLK